MKLISLKMQNFKRIKEFTLHANGENLDIYGENSTGKSSIYSAFLWLLFGKDSSGYADYNIKPTDKQGNELHHLQTLVEGEFLIDNKPVKLCRAYNEKWSKKKGQEEQTMSGHETQYFIDDVPQKQILYKQYISVHIDEDIFKIITNPLYFNDEKQMPWKKRREILLSLVQNVDDAQLIEQSDQFKEIALRQNSIDETNKYISAKLRKVREDIDETQIRMKEVTSSMDQTLDADILKKEKQEYVLSLGDIENRMTNIAELIRESAEHQTKITVLKSKLENRAAELKRQQHDKIAFTEAKGKLSHTETELRYAKEAYANDKERLRNLQSSIEKMLILLQKKNEAYKTPYAEPDENNFVCPTCKQSLPEEDIEAKRAEIKAAWLNGKTQLKEECTFIVNEGKEKRAEEGRLNTSIAELDLKVNNLKTEMQALRLNLSELEIKEEMEPDIAADSKYQAILTELETLNAKVLPTFDEQMKELQEEKAAVNKKLSGVMEQIAVYNAELKAKDRLVELKTKLKALVKEQATLEKQKLKIDEFLSYKCGILEIQLNEKFTRKVPETISWRLFEILVNGEIKDACECLIDGVSFGGANDAAKLNAGLAIIEVLCGVYSKTAPIFIDNAERVNNIIDIDTQMITLRVSKDNPLIIKAKEELKEAI